MVKKNKKYMFLKDFYQKNGFSMQKFIKIGHYAQYANRGLKCKIMLKRVHCAKKVY